MFKAPKTCIEGVARTIRTASVILMRFAARSRVSPFRWDFEAGQNLTVKMHLGRGCSSARAGNAALGRQSSCRNAADNKGLRHLLATEIPDKLIKVNLNREGSLISQASSHFFGTTGSLNSNC